MNEKILSQLTFGFEIEGWFKDTILPQLKKPYIFKTDGSIHTDGDKVSDKRINDFIHNGKGDSQHCSLVVRCANCAGTGHLIYSNGITEESINCSICYGNGRLPDNNINLTNSNGPSSEYASNVYSDCDEFLHDVSVFNADTYEYNNTCGLHVHIGSKNWKKLFNAASDWALMKRLQTEAQTYCDCQKYRLQNYNRFCKFFVDKKHIVQLAKKENNSRGEFKYLFCRFHPETNTLEFRFFSPCKHKVENIKKMLSSLTDILAEESVVNFYATAEIGTNHIKFDEKRTLDSKELIVFVKELNNKRKSFAIGYLIKKYKLNPGNATEYVAGPFDALPFELKDSWNNFCMDEIIKFKKENKIKLNNQENRYISNVPIKEFKYSSGYYAQDRVLDATAYTNTALAAQQHIRSVIASTIGDGNEVTSNDQVLVEQIDPTPMTIIDNRPRRSN